MRPRAHVQSVVLYNSKDDNGDYIPLKIEVNSWVALQSDERRGCSVDGAYKAQVTKFKVIDSMVTEIEVQHAYMKRELSMHPARPNVLSSACNYLYPSRYRDWIDPKSILQVLCVIHAEIGELTRGSRNHRQLLQDSIFFYNAEYIPDPDGGYGYTNYLPLPSFDDPAWPLPDMATTEAFRAQMREDFMHACKPGTGSKITRISWFMPIGVMVDLFAVAKNVHRTPTMFVFKHISNELFASLMDKGWNEVIILGADEIKCVIDPQSIFFKYHIGRSMLYANFQFSRLRLKHGGLWEQIDQHEVVRIVTIQCVLGAWRQEIEVGHNWPLTSVRSEIEMALGSFAVADFSMSIIQEGNSTMKINRRREKSVTVGEVLPPKILLLTSIL